MLEPLSPEGLRRRDQILLLAKAAARQRRNRRLIGRSVTAMLLIAIAALVIRMPRRRVEITSPPAALPIVVAPTPAPTPEVAVEYIQTDTTITDRLTLPPEPPRWKNISDAELLEELSAAGQPAGIVTINGKTFLLPRSRFGI